jgi:hypothetical protein
MQTNRWSCGKRGGLLAAESGAASDREEASIRQTAGQARLGPHRPLRALVIATQTSSKGDENYDN